MKVDRRCPDCGGGMRFEWLLEIVKCPWCRSVMHPESTKPLRRGT